ncbi:3-oxoacyl-[acyl-carrier-protein] reductase FabG [Paraconexibacter sp. AEG42_29]|uniref:3-oxoacyl-[acyl-carrier-protein] reductase FabG n=1 Tax=Paraconexibacter sp. AEG42_29 TaxID=2997339 RepID=A0AAU7B3K1_9ACTN
MSLKNNLSGRIALVTAAAGAGIGQATARLLAESGADVVVTDLDPGRTERVAGQIAEATGRRVIGRPLNVVDEDAIAALVAEIHAEWGAIDILVNNAGTSEPAPVWDTPTDSWRRVIDICLTGHFLTMKAVLPRMMERRAGSIVNIASIEAWSSTTPGNTAYHAAKAGVLALTRSTAKQVAPHGVRVNGVAPGLVPNPFLNRMLDPEDLERHASLIPLGRPVDPEEIADAVLFLAGDGSTSITGETINVSGGAYMRA